MSFPPQAMRRAGPPPHAAVVGSSGHGATPPLTLTASSQSAWPPAGSALAAHQARLISVTEREAIAQALRRAVHDADRRRSTVVADSRTPPTLRRPRT